MKKAAQFLVLLIILLYTSFSYNKINYLEPVPDAKYVSIGNNIIIGFDKEIDLDMQSIANSISVTGSKSIAHNGSIVITKDNKRIIFKPDIPFAQNEKVTIRISNDLLRKINSGNDVYEYSFYTSSKELIKNPTGNNTNPYNSPGIRTDLDLFNPPLFTVTNYNNPSDGYLFLAPWFNLTYLSIYDKTGSLFWSSNTVDFGGDFKLQPNGNRTYFDGNKLKHFELDQYNNIIDTFYCGNGYTTDIHELRLLTNNHAWVMAYDTEIVNMRQIVEGGDSVAHVVGTIIQEIDENNNVVFQWRSWDHFLITDALHENMLSHQIDAVHGNAIEIDNDGNILLSSRHLDEITKINRTTGAIIWRLGGLHNQFTFINDAEHFTYQHAIRRISNGHITLFDNGNFHTPPHSRAVEYSIDEVNKTATLVWQYRNQPDIYGYWGGYVQRLENGNTLIGWGGTFPTVTEVDSAGTIRFEGTYISGINTYRAYKFTMTGIPVPVINETSETPSVFSLNQNFPNPFNPVTNITYEIAKASFVEITVFDILGREVKKIVSEYMQPGNYSAKFDGSQLSSGIYIYKLKAGDFLSTRKMILIK